VVWSQNAATGTCFASLLVPARALRRMCCDSLALVSAVLRSTTARSSDVAGRQVRVGHRLSPALGLTGLPIAFMRVSARPGGGGGGGRLRGRAGQPLGPRIVVACKHRTRHMRKTQKTIWFNSVSERFCGRTSLTERYRPQHLVPPKAFQ
jgi:hypothetical protein